MYTSIKASFCTNIVYLTANIINVFIWISLFRLITIILNTTFKDKVCIFGSQIKLFDIKDNLANAKTAYKTFVS